MRKSPSGRAPGRPKSNEAASSMRTTVLEAASRLFMEKGYKPVSLNQIAERANVTKASVYYYFGSKAELFAASVTEMMQRIAAISARILDGPEPVRERLEKVAAAKLSRSHIEFETLMREAVPHLSEEQLAAVRQAEQTVHDVLAACFASAMSDGQIAEGHPVLLAHAFSSLLMMGNRAPDLADALAGKPLSSQIVDLFWSGISPRERETQ